MTPVEELRRAAALMRERAQAATPGPWLWDGGAYDGSHGVGCVWTIAPSVRGGTIVTVDMDDLYPRGEYSPQDDMKHIASWHPMVALPVADLIDRIAWTWEIDPDLQSRVGGDELLAVARAYLAGERP